MKKYLTACLALALTSVSLVMSASAAIARAEGRTDRWMLGAVSVAIVLCVHLAPALLRSTPRFILWPVWIVALAAAVYGHAGYFSMVSRVAGEARATESPEARAMAERLTSIERALGAIKARPVSSVAALLARETDSDRRSALAAELVEAQRKARLSDELVTLSSNKLSHIQVTSITDPVTSLLSVSSGVRPEILTLTVSLCISCLLELLGMLLWKEALTVPAYASLPPIEAPMEDVPLHAREPISDVEILRAAIARGECSGTVRDIRRVLSCSQANASSLRRQIQAS